MGDLAETARAVLALEPRVTAGYLFGSAASGQMHALSDVDVAVLLDAGLAERAAFEVELALGAQLEAALQTRVDLVDLRRAPPFLQFQVLRTGELLLDRDPDARSLFVMRALNRYYDMQPYLDYQNACALTRFVQEA